MRCQIYRFSYGVGILLPSFPEELQPDCQFFESPVRVKGHTKSATLCSKIDELYINDNYYL